METAGQGDLIAGNRLDPVGRVVHDQHKHAQQTHGYAEDIEHPRGEGSEGYPPDMDTLVNGVEVAGGKKLRFLRRIPVDPMTGNTDWGLRSMQDDTDSDSWGGQDVFDVYTKSEGTALDGTKYKDW